MKRIVFLLFWVGQLIPAQTSNAHVVYFETAQYSVPDIETNRLVLFIQGMRDVQIERISIYGFTDDRGTDNYNLGLSQNRANAIKKIFSRFGVDENLISNVDGKGEVLLRVVSSENLSIIRGLNRKVEINIEYQKSVKSKKTIKDRERVVEDFLKENISVGDKVVLENILFKTGYSSLEKKSIKSLEVIALSLLERKDVYFTIQGHVCCTNNSRDAIDKKTGKRNLSMARARYIYDFLIKRGVERKRMKYVGLKNKFPLGGETKYDRRVEIKITYLSKKG